MSTFCLAIISSIIFIFPVSCSQQEVIEEPTVGDLYLNEVLDVMEENSIFKDSINWVKFRDSVMNFVPHPKTILQTVRSIEFAIKLLGDKHSYYSSGSTVLFDHDVCTWTVDYREVQPMDDIGVVKVEGFQPALQYSDVFADDAMKYAKAIQNSIKEQDHAGIKGWIVDLRNNGGGIMYPMLAGIGPVLGEDTVGYFYLQGGDKKYYPYWYEKGKAINSGYVHIEIDNYYTLINPNPKVAVLIDKANSAGEGIVVGFVNRPNTKLFGTSGTCGRTSGMYGKQLSDGALMAVAHSWMLDRTKKTWKGPIPPNESSRTDDEAIEQAIKWIRE